jgi:mobilome CxxCx(11)CxxC protein
MLHLGGFSVMLRTDATDRVCSECWNRGIHAHGTGALFLKRSRKYTKLLQALSFFGIVVPLLIGGVVIGFGTKGSYLDKLLIAAAAAGIVQLVFSAWSIVYSWADSLQYSLESAADNFDLALKFKELAEQATSPPDDLEIRAAALKARDDARQMNDAKKGVSQKELRYAHRAGLRQFGRACDECKQVPRSMEPTKCNTCGSF